MNFDSITPGTSPEPLTIGPITRTDIVRYQGASGDMNPVHHDEPFATGAGFDAPLGVGMYPAGVMHAWLGEWVGPERVRGCRTRWKAAYFPGDSLTFTAVVAESDESARRVVVESTCRNQEGVVTMLGWMTVEFE
jgi:acyl dehydratase